MFLSKSAVTLLSTVGASSVPLVSVVALYKIKSFSQGGNVEISPSTSTEENVIAEATQTPPAQEAKTDTQTELQPVPPPPPANPPTISTTTTNPPSSPPATKPDNKNNEDTAAKKEDTTQIKNIEIKSTDVGEEAIKITTAKEMTDFLNNIQALTKAMLKGEKHEAQNDQDLSETIKSFKGLLQEHKKTLSDKDEQKNINEVIDALTKLEAKSSST